MRASLPATIEIRQALSSEVFIRADATNFHQVLMNLCTNAAHAMRKTGGVIEVQLKEIVLDKKDASQYVDLTPGKYLQISVEDIGHGIPEDIQERIFDPFFTTKDPGEGTGIGLSAVHGIVKELKGAITVFSEVGKGTVFTVLFPVISELSDVKSHVVKEPFVGGTEKILFVDDEEVQVELAQELLDQLGYNVTTFSESILALDHFKQDPGKYDLLITDMTMQGLTGDVLIQKIRIIRPDIPVILCTGFSETMDEDRAKSIGINAFMYKPVVAKDLSHTIRRVLDQKAD